MYHERYCSNDHTHHYCDGDHTTAVIFAPKPAPRSLKETVHHLHQLRRPCAAAISAAAECPSSITFATPPRGLTNCPTRDRPTIVVASPNAAKTERPGRFSTGPPRPISMNAGKLQRRQRVSSNSPPICNSFLTDESPYAPGRRTVSTRLWSFPSIRYQPLRRAHRHPRRDQHQAEKKSGRAPEPRVGEDRRRPIDVTGAERANSEYVPYLVTGEASAVHASASSDRLRHVHRNPSRVVYQFEPRP